MATEKSKSWHRLEEANERLFAITRSERDQIVNLSQGGSAAEIEAAFKKYHQHAFQGGAIYAMLDILLDSTCKSAQQAALKSALI
jgi:hypothetical protein